jgi:hypothetical protein
MCTKYMRGLDTLADSLLKFDPYLTAGDIAFLMGKHANTILLAMQKGEIPVSTGPGERPRVKLSTLMEWGKVNKGQFQPPPSIVPPTVPTATKCNCKCQHCAKCEGC